MGWDGMGSGEMIWDEVTVRQPVNSQAVSQSVGGEEWVRAGSQPYRQTADRRTDPRTGRPPARHAGSKTVRPTADRQTDTPVRQTDSQTDRQPARQPQGSRKEREGTGAGGRMEVNG